MAVCSARAYGVALVAAVAFVAAACGEKKAEPPSGPPPNAKRVDASKAGHIAGRVAIEGPVPQNGQIKMSGDPACIRANTDGASLESFVVDNSGLENVFVYVKDGLSGYYFDAPTEAVKLDQKGCRYHPHVFGLQVGQPLEVTNSDPTLHNVHAMAHVNQEFNASTPFTGTKITKRFTAREVMVPFKCDVHGWMNAYAGVLDHPYFAVSANGGRFELKNLPAGTYTIEAWHEKLGTETQSVTIGEKETKAITFTFKASAPAGL
jgi:plastocyanin